MLAIADEGVDVSLGDAEVQALLVGTGVAPGVHALGGSPPPCAGYLGHLFINRDVREHDLARITHRLHTEMPLYWLLLTSVRKIDSMVFQHPPIFLRQMIFKPWKK
jgi:hypothetical protein